MSDWNEALSAAVRAVENNGDLSIEHRHILQIVAAISSLKRPADQDGWLPIESAPKEGTLVLLWNDDSKEQWIGNNISSLRADCPHWGAWAKFGGGKSIFPQPKLWRPLPSAPNEAVRVSD